MTVSIEKRQLIVNQFKKGKNANEISDVVEVPVRTVRSILQQYRETGNVTPKTSTGRHRLLSPRDERQVFLSVRREPTTRPSTLTRIANRKVSVWTIRRSLHRGGLHPAKMKRKPRLTAAQRKARLEWAMEYAKKPRDFWDHVIFSDESSFHTNEALKGKVVWRFAHEELQSPFVQPVTKFGGHKLQVWGCVTSQGVGWACSLPEGIDSDTYLVILKNELQWTISLYFKEFNGVVFQQDGAGPHRANVVKNYLKLQKYSVLPWPAHSPDLSPIENLWANLKKRLEEKHGEIPKTKLWEVVDEEWEETSKEYCKNLFASMPDRIQAVINARGGYTKY
jgi:transposase